MAKSEKTTWLGIIGDADPIEHGGGIVGTNKYGPFVTYFEPTDLGDSVRGSLALEGLVRVYTVPIEPDVTSDLDWVDWKDVSDFTGMSVKDIKQAGKDPDPVVRSGVYESVAAYYGWQNLDDDRAGMTIQAAKKKFGRKVDAAHKAEARSREALADATYTKRENPSTIKNRVLR
jgi:hypothetical protein